MRAFISFPKKLDQVHGKGLKGKVSLSTSSDLIRERAEVLWLSNRGQDKKPLSWELGSLLIRVETPSVDPYSPAWPLASPGRWGSKEAGGRQWERRLYLVYKSSREAWSEWQFPVSWYINKSPCWPGKDEELNGHHRSPGCCAFVSFVQPWHPFAAHRRCPFLPAEMVGCCCCISLVCSWVEKVTGRQNSFCSLIIPTASDQVHEQHPDCNWVCCVFPHTMVDIQQTIQAEKRNAGGMAKPRQTTGINETTPVCHGGVYQIQRHWNWQS